MADIGLIVTPHLLLLEKRGDKEVNWTSHASSAALSAMLILGASLMAAGHKVTLHNLESGTDRVAMGKVKWNGLTLQKVVMGTDWKTLDPSDHEIWGIPANFSSEEEIVRSIIRHLTGGGARVIVGGSATFMESQKYIEMGASVVVKDKSGGSNAAAIELVLNEHDTPDKPYWVDLPKRDKRPRKQGSPRLHPDRWPLPSVDWARQTLGHNLWQPSADKKRSPAGKLFEGDGCDQDCNFCLTWMNWNDYSWMGPSQMEKWVARLQEAGMNSLEIFSDQFLVRVLDKGGREALFTTMQMLRDRGIAYSFRNGLDLSKLTLGKGIGINYDTTPDKDLIKLLLGWDSKKETGCFQVYIPGERPVGGASEYKKLLPTWEAHLEMMRTIVGETEIPDLFYGVILGLKDDSEDTYKILRDRLLKLREMLLGINKNLILDFNLNSLQLFPGTLITREMREAGLVEYDDSVLIGKQTPMARTNHLSIERLVELLAELYIELNGHQPGRRGVTCFDVVEDNIM